MNRGKIIILAIVAVAVGVSIYGIWYRHRQMERVLSAFSPRVAQLIAFAPEVEIVELGPVDENPSADGEKTVSIEGAARQVIAKESPGASKGFSNLRTDLVRDSSYDWQRSAEPAGNEGRRDWPYVLIFRDGADAARLAIDADNCRIMLLDHGPQLSIAPISQAVASYFAEQFPSPAKADRK